MAIEIIAKFDKRSSHELKLQVVDSKVSREEKHCSIFKVNVGAVDHNPPKRTVISQVCGEILRDVEIVKYGAKTWSARLMEAVAILFVPVEPIELLNIF